MNRQRNILAVVMIGVSCYAQQPPSAYIVKAVIATGPLIPGHPLPANASIEGVALNDNGEIAFVSRWVEGSRDRTAVFTGARLIATDRDMIDGKPVTRINAASLAINGPGQVAFEADFGFPSRTGIFIERKFVVALGTAGSANDFTLSDDGRIALKPGIIAAAAPNARSSGSPYRLNPNWQRGVGFKIPGPLNGVLFGRNSPIRSADPNVVLQPGSANPAARQSAPVVQTRAPAVPAHTCPLPEFPYPGSWAVGDEMAGPITSHLFEGPPKTKPYISPFFGRMATPFRTIQFAADCRPLLVAIGDAALPGRFEIWTPNGLLARTGPDGFLDLKGISADVSPKQLVRGDAPLRINRRGQIAIPVSLEPGGFAILLATPASGTH